ncbi:ABC transporter substrate-binding protein [Mangrovactinospora gilvigrisea]|uniref:ABC transporter substrate-binding protein n=1 Tax=Mangrovactinospora gilvigrisea TaxID=1428644 RepID=A0A1J7BA40_9ACTN|nr:substrate-binding domain-containing protein [Mangrovactinospora gilvigrisea]OIV35559.1 ABC transporter substrate-binding protein [Mangrovactinospora gilvigrisea]
MHATTRRAVIAAAAVSMAVSLAACGKAGSSSSSSGSSGSKSPSSASGKIGLLLPENQTTRYESFDRPIITKTIKKECPKCEIDYQNAGGHADQQTQQMTAAINNGDKVIIVDPQDYKAIASSVKTAVAKGIKVIAYDRFAEGPLSGYVSFDNTKIGQQQGQALLTALGSKATPSAKVVMINGLESDPNAGMFKAGAESVLKGKVNIAYEQNGDWLASTASEKMTSAVNKLGAKNIAGVYSANDGMAAAIATVMKSNGMSGKPLTGQDAQVDGIQRILAGTQSADIYKDYAAEGKVAGEMAVAALQGKKLTDVATSTQTSTSGDKVPSTLLTTKIITKANIKQTVIDGGQLTVKQICTSAYAAFCAKAGLK